MRESLGLNRAIVVLFAAFLGLIVAYTLLHAPFIILLTLAGLVAIAVIRFPEVGMVAVLAMTASFVFYFPMPQISLSMLALYPSDAFLILLLVLTTRDFAVSGFRLRIRTPMDGPLALFYIAGLIGFIVAVLRSGRSIGDAMWDFRLFSYYLLYFVLTRLLEDDSSVRRLVAGMMLLSAAVALGMALQSTSLSITQYFGGWAGSHQVYGSVVRVFPPGAFLLFATLVLVISLLLFDSRAPRLVLYGLTTLLAIGIVITFSRVLWLLTGLAVLMLLYKATIGPRLHLLLGLGMVILLSLSIASAYIPLVEIKSALFQRFASIFSGDLFATSSAQDRGVEFSYAWNAIKRWPLFGGGLGHVYRPAVFGPTDSETDFIHNSYLWVWKDLGLIGLLPFLILISMAVYRGITWSDSMPHGFHRAVVLANGVSLLCLAAFALQGSPFIGNWNLSVIAVLIGLNEALIHQANAKHKVGSTTSNRNN
jgi:O-antigen ligase